MYIFIEGTIRLLWSHTTGKGAPPAGWSPNHFVLLQQVQLLIFCALVHGLTHY